MGELFPRGEGIRSFSSICTSLYQTCDFVCFRVGFFTLDSVEIEEVFLVGGILSGVLSRYHIQSAQDGHVFTLKD